MYIDNAASLDSQGRSCTEKWLGELGHGQAGIVNVRPDGYVGSIMRIDTKEAFAGQTAAKALDDYYGGFLHVQGH